MPMSNNHVPTPTGSTEVKAEYVYRFEPTRIEVAGSLYGSIVDKIVVEITHYFPNDIDGEPDVRTHVYGTSCKANGQKDGRASYDHYHYPSDRAWLKAFIDDATRRADEAGVQAVEV